MDLLELTGAPQQLLWVHRHVLNHKELIGVKRLFFCKTFQLALIFFAVLHVPINVPALAVSLQRSVDVNHEIVGHGLSNLLGGLVGVPQSYLVYSNSLLFMRSGGATHFSGMILAVATIAVMMAGGDIVGYVPTIVVGSLIFHLGFDLVKESLWDTWWSGISKWEYATILCIVFVMGFFG
jgi:MFS superfamily sulfate permease-like transporter